MHVTSVAEVDADVADWSAEEHQVTGQRLGAGDGASDLRLLAAAMRQAGAGRAERELSRMLTRSTAGMNPTFRRRGSRLSGDEHRCGR